MRTINPISSHIFQLALNRPTVHSIKRQRNEQFIFVCVISNECNYMRFTHFYDHQFRFYYANDMETILTMVAIIISILLFMHLFRIEKTVFRLWGGSSLAAYKQHHEISFETKNHFIV